MAKIKPFKGMRYADIIKIDDVVSPPYDIISESEQEQLYARSEYNVIRLEYGKEKKEDNENENRYTRASAYLNDWLKKGILKIDDKPALYVYEQNFTLPDGTEKSLRGIICLVKLEEFSSGVIFPHEDTLSKAKKDRFNLMSSTNCNFSQVYSLYMDFEKKIEKNINDAVSGKMPKIQFNSDEGVVQKLWIITDSDLIDKICSDFENKKLFIADGHHRYETALNYHKSCKTEESGYIMMFLVDLENEGLVVFPTHRMVYGLDNFNEDQIINKLQMHFKTEKIPVSDDDKKKEIEKTLSQSEKGTFILYTGKNYFHKITLRNKDIMKNMLPDKSEAYRGLDVSVLHTLILDKIMGIDTENMANQRNLVYTKSTKQAIDEVDNKIRQCSFIMNAPHVSEIKEVSLAGEKMPQKSTYFWPKLITGLVMNNFNK